MTAAKATPRTDAVAICWDAWLDGQTGTYVQADFARQLERELQAAREAVNDAPLLSGVTDLDGLIAALECQKQCDTDGQECQVSRQAVDEAIGVLKAIRALKKAAG